MIYLNLRFRKRRNLKADSHDKYDNPNKSKTHTKFPRMMKIDKSTSLKVSLLKIIFELFKV